MRTVILVEGIRPSIRLVIRFDSYFARLVPYIRQYTCETLEYSSKITRCPYVRFISIDSWMEIKFVLRCWIVRLVKTRGRDILARILRSEHNDACILFDVVQEMLFRVAGFWSWKSMAQIKPAYKRIGVKMPKTPTWPFAGGFCSVVDD